MTREEAKHIVDVAFSVPQAVRRAGEDRTYYQDEISEAKNMAIQALSQEPCDDAISREALLKKQYRIDDSATLSTRDVVNVEDIEDAPSVTQKSGKCKNCKYFEYDSVAKVDGIPLIVAHEICNKWGDGCKTSEEGYCYLFEPQESEDKG